MIKTVLVSFMVALATLVQPESSIETKKSLIGVWEYNQSEFPYEFQKGKVTFFQQGKEFKVKVKMDYSALEGKKVVVEGDAVSFQVDIDYQTAYVKLKQEGSTLKGNVNVDGEWFPLELKKVK
ncbi:hypothetical protein [Sediminicola luteus]|uniref:Lipocalin-like domain-containing protein n=1 Tax=Sediminicola luteus TaxID=319238 RepID=A0A2A4GFC8_9FLAO|nr:hypothetical protein [Sediminicola luteus]PCE66680.1 hypothetical protein B7P33_05150 [Sediminicola luteus]